MLRRSPLGLALAVLLLATGPVGASGAQSAAGGATAHAYAIKVLVPGQAGGATPEVAAPPNAVQFSGGFSYNGLVTAGSANASVTALGGTNASAAAGAEVDSLSLFGGEITASSVVVHAQASAKPSSATGDAAGSAVTNLVALGQSVPSGGGAALADWGSLQTIETGASNAPTSGYHGFVTGVDIRLTADHDGLPAGTSILVGYADVSAQAAPAPPPPKPPAHHAKSPKTHTPKPPAAPSTTSPLVPRSAPLKITPALHTPGGHVFPVYGPSSFIDTYGAGRSDVSGGWHHGDDIFAPLGAPVLAVASGTVFSVGWNNVGGNRLWLRDGAGNEYYYAHLSAYTPLARNGRAVRAGDVLGFVGNTGDAQTTPFHLHFEVHPVALLGLGYDGAVDPTSYLSAWKHLQDVSFAGGTAWAPLGHSARAPKSGAILISATDISIANGLDPDSLAQVVGAAGLEQSKTASARLPRRHPAAGQRSAAGRTH